MRVCAVAVALLVLGACGGGGGGKSSVGRFSSPQELSGALNRAGEGCTDFSPDASKEESVDQQGSCTVEGERTRIYTFKDSGQLGNWVGIGESVGCSMGKSFGIRNFSYVKGDRWVVQPDTATAAKAVAAKFGGRAVTHNC